jgi:hypothetical protein
MDRACNMDRKNGHNCVLLKISHKNKHIGNCDIERSIILKYILPK